MQTARKYGSYVVIAGIAAFVLFYASSAFKRLNTNGGNNGPSVNLTKGDYEPPFRHDGTTYAVQGEDTLGVFRTEYAKSPAELEFGMMNRKHMDPDMGMLFFMIPGGDRMRSFWMKNTFVSLDIIYINSQHEVVSIQRNAQPLNESSLPSEGPAAFVLEVKGGTCDELGIDKGAKILW